MRKWRLTLVVLSLGIAMSVTVRGEDKAPETKPQTTCPVMGGKINKDLHVDHEGRRIYVCCPGCFPKLKADPAKYIRKLEAEGITLAKATTPQTTCPVTGKKISKKLYVDHQRKRIYVASRRARRTVKKDPAKYIKQIEAQGITLDEAVNPQTSCPIMHQPINKNLYVDYQGKRLYVCCHACVAEARRNPAKYIKQLEAAGITLERAPKK